MLALRSGCQRRVDRHQALWDNNPLTKEVVAGSEVESGWEVDVLVVSEGSKEKPRPESQLEGDLRILVGPQTFFALR